jgi:RNA polymerase sigma-70 factor (ECF subfamily)
LARLREENVAAGKTLEFDQLKVFLSAPTSDGAYDRIAVQLGLATETVAVKVYRLRKRYGELIRTEVAHTVADPADVEEELRHLFDAVGR